MAQGRAPSPPPMVGQRTGPVSSRDSSAAAACRRPRLLNPRPLPAPPVGLWACGPVAPLVRAICTHRGSRLVTSPVEARHVTGRGLVSPSPPVLGFRFRFYVVGLGFLV